MNATPMNNLDDLIAAAKRPVVEWKPDKPGDLVAGKVVDLDTIETKHGPAMCVTLLNEAENTEHRVAVFHDVLKRKLSKVPPEPDDLLVIVFLGLKHGQETDFYDYKVIHTDAKKRPKVAGNGKPAPPDLVDDVDDMAPEADRAYNEPTDDEPPFDNAF